MVVLFPFKHFADSPKPLQTFCALTKIGWGKYKVNKVVFLSGVNQFYNNLAKNP